MGRIIEDPPCICNCVCCLEECAPKTLCVAVQGVRPRTPTLVCPTCGDWNTYGRIEMRQVKNDEEECQWASDEELRAARRQFLHSL
jgi:hypothetical protein